MNAIKSLLAVSALTVGVSANASVYTITGSLVSTSSPITGFFVDTVAVFGPTPPPLLSVPANQNISLSGSLDIVGTSIVSGSFTTANHGVFGSLAGSSTANYTTWDSIGGGASFTPGGPGWSVLGTEVTNCAGAAIALCNLAMGLPAYSYSLVSTGANQWTLDTVSANAAMVVIRTYDLVGTPSVPVPAAAWLFGSGLLCLGSVKRKRKAV